MRQSTIQTEKQEQRLEQTQTLSAQQVLTVRLTEMSVEALRQRMEDECQENPWLEKVDESLEEQNSSDASSTYPEEGDNEYKCEDDYRTEDDIPDYLIRPAQGKSAPEYVEWGESLTFYDRLKEQAGEFDLNEHQRQIMDYLIGSLESSGLITKPLYQVVDELDIYQGVCTTEQEVEQVLQIIWQFDPPGIGARSIQECLLIQIARKETSTHRELLKRVIEQCYDDFIKKRWDHIQHRLHLSDVLLGVVQRELLRLNPRPGMSLAEESLQGKQHITPDFFVEVDTEGQIHLTLNEGDIPQLVVSPEALEKVKNYEKEGERMSRMAQEDLQFTRKYIYRGQQFIQAIQMRRNSMIRTMQAILKIQYRYFSEGDETLLVPMRLEDVATLSGIDLSTVSRVCSNKYVQTMYGTMPLRWFFSSKVNQGDDAVSVRKAKLTLETLIQQEDTRHPYTDDRLASMMQERGYQIARRTIAKYREQMGYPVARLRKEHK